MSTTTVWLIALGAVLLLWLKGRKQHCQCDPDASGSRSSAADRGQEIIPDTDRRDAAPPMTLQGMADRLARMKMERGPYDY